VYQLVFLGIHDTQLDNLRRFHIDGKKLGFFFFK